MGFQDISIGACYAWNDSFVYLGNVAFRTSEVVFVEDGGSSQGVVARVDIVHVKRAAHEDSPAVLTPGGFMNQVEPHAHSASRYSEQGHLVRVTSKHLENVENGKLS